MKTNPSASPQLIVELEKKLDKSDEKIFNSSANKFKEMIT